MRSNKKVIVVGPAYPFRGGIADTNEALARALLRDNYEVEILTFSTQYPNFLFPGKTQYREGKAPENLKIKRCISSVNPFTWIQTAQYINRVKPEMVLIRYWLPFMAPCLGTIARMCRAQVIGITDNVVPHEPSILHRLFTPYFLASCQKLMALSKSVLGDLKRLSSNPSTFFPHPINDQFGSIISKQIARENLGLDQDEKFILFFGFVRKYKGLDILIKSMADEHFPKDVKLIVAGEFYDDPKEYTDLIGDLNLSDRILLYNQFIDNSQIASYFCAADLITQTYRTATQSGITQMALHFEKPVLVTRVGGLDEFVSDGQTGYFAEVSESDIARKISLYFDANDHDMTESIRTLKMKYSWDTFTQHLKKFANE